MKLLLLVVSALVLLQVHASAIPQSFGVGNGFFGAVGVPFEKYAAAGEAWTPGAELKGRWQARVGSGASADGTETLDLAMTAEVFGIPAAQVSAERNGRSIRRFIVRFDGSKQKGNAGARGGDLFSRVTTNLQAMAGEPKSKSAGGEMTFRHEAATIVARRGRGQEVVVEFTPAR
jgi:hypothetical protein